MTPNLTYFVTELKTLADAPAWEYVGGETPLILIAAKHDEVGGLTVFDDGDEYTVGIGELHHSHFSHYSYHEDTIELRMEHAARDAANYVVDIVNDRVLFTVDYQGDRCIGSSSRFLGFEPRIGSAVQFLGMATDTQQCHSRSYLWSGPFSDDVSDK